MVEQSEGVKAAMVKTSAYTCKDCFNEHLTF